MQWTVTAAEIDGMPRNRLQRLCKFVFFVCACTMDVSLPHPTSILGVKICDQETGTNLHTQERPKDLNAPAVIAPISIIRELVLVRMYTFSGWRHLLRSPVTFSCHVLLFVMFSLADTKTWRDTSTSSTHHHDESLLL